MAVIESAVTSMKLFDGVPDTPAARLERFVLVVQHALEDEGASQQFATHGVSVRIHLSDAPDTGVTLFLDRTPAEIVTGTGGGQADVQLLLDSHDLEAICCEGTYLPTKIVAGEVTYEGPVRKFLRMLPVLRRAAQDVLDRGDLRR